MWRTFASLGLTFGAMAWAIVSSALCFFYGSSLWIDQFGRFGAFYSALVSFAVCFYGAKMLLRAADKMTEPYTGPFDASAYSGAPPETFYRDWARHAAGVMRNRRYAFYVRTRQWDRLSDLEAEETAFRRCHPAMDTMPEPPHPRRTSMAGQLTFDENQRAARRTSITTPKVERWAVMDD